MYFCTESRQWSAYFMRGMDGTVESAEKEKAEINGQAECTAGQARGPALKINGI
jgi:hypothetical protein